MTVQKQAPLSSVKLSPIPGKQVKDCSLMSLYHFAKHVVRAIAAMGLGRGNECRRRPGYIKPCALLSLVGKRQSLKWDKDRTTRAWVLISLRVLLRE